MKILLTGGGTAGHVTPLLAVASKISGINPNANIRYVGKYGDDMSSIVKNHHEITKTYKIHAGKLRRYNGKSFLWYLTQPGLVFHNIKDLFLLILGFIKSVFILISWRPDVVFVKGGYVGLPVGLAASILRIKIITHDSDVMPGLTNRILSRYAAILAVGMPVKNYPQYTGKNIVYTGIPVRDQFVYPINKQEALNKLNISNSDPVVVIVGGSLGAIRVNNSVIKVANELVNNSGSNIIWYTGDTQYDEINSMVQKMSSDISSKITVEPFSNQLEVAFVAADVVVSRAGATTIAELSILKKPTIIIPNPLLTGGHQLKNADMLLDNNAALVLTEEQLLNNPNVLVESVNKLLSDNSLRENLSDNIGKLAKPDAALHIAQLILGLDDAKAENELV